ncbi:hypothetical protein OROHE_004835 [Orobanche hederae]
MLSNKERNLKFLRIFSQVPQTIDHVVEVCLGIKQVSRIPIRVRAQKPSYLFARKDFSAASKNNASGEPGARGEPSGSGSNMSKVVMGSLALGFAGIAAYQTGYLDNILVNE